MDDGFKCAVIYVALGSLVGVSTVMPSGECGPRQMCAVVPDHGGHTHDREPAPTQTVQQISVAVSTASSSAGSFFQVVK